MDWQLRRKLMYGFATLITISAVSVYFARDIFFPDPTCFDTKQNGFEIGVDCGGTCSLRCASEVVPLSVLWANALLSTKSTYDLVAMVSNKNINNASKYISYTFVVYNAEGRVIEEIQGKTITPLDGDFPIIRQNIHLSQIPDKVTLQIEDTRHYKVDEKPTSPTVRVMNERYEAGSVPRIYATLVNTKRTTVLNLPVRVVLFDQDNNAYAVGEMTIPRLEKEEVKEITFTWREELKSAPVRIRVYPIFDPCTLEFTCDK